jgi:hypothetical protein
MLSLPSLNRLIAVIINGKSLLGWEGVEILLKVGRYDWRERWVWGGMDGWAGNMGLMVIPLVHIHSECTYIYPFFLFKKPKVSPILLSGQCPENYLTVSFKLGGC